MDLPAYTVVIATFERPDELAGTLDGLAEQTHRPSRVVIVDASPDDRTRLLAQTECRLELQYERANNASAARQRNQGAAHAETPLTAFCDDDLRLQPQVFELLCSPFHEEQTGGVAGRIHGLAHPVPSALLRAYYRLQSGFDHPNYGARLFGPGINCLPCYTADDPMLIPADWLNSTCVVYRTDLFTQHRFPEFDGYSFMEDVHLSARVARNHRLYFHRDASYEHLDAPSRFKRNTRALSRMRAHHQRVVAREIMGLREPELSAKLLLHKLFVTAALLRSGGPDRMEAILGTWT